MIETGLSQHIISLKNYFLLARGEFILTFLQESFEIMSLPPRADSAEHDINSGPFAQAQSALEEDIFLSRFRFSIKQSGFNYDDFSYISDLSQLASIRRIKNIIKLGIGRKIGAIWHNRKHPILPGFSSHITIKGAPPLNLSFMIQSEKEISGQYVSAPVYSENIDNGLVVNFALNAGILKVMILVNNKIVTEIEKKFEKNTFRIVIYLEVDKVKVDIDNSL